jgi:hypothetical protein
MYAVSVPGLCVIYYLLTHNSKINQRKKERKNNKKKENQRNQQGEVVDKQTGNITNNQKNT